MAANSRNRRWIVLLLIAIGVVLVATLPRGATDDETEQSDSLASPDTPDSEAPDDVAGERDGGLASKRVIEGCEPVAEAKKYEEFVDGRALAVLRWNNMSERAAKLKIPVYVKSVDDGAVAISVLEIPMRSQYLNIWMNSGHIERAEGDTFLLDPCASWIERWESMERASGNDDAQ
jgi:hypothetical protein